MEARAKEESGRKKYTIKGYATVPNHIYPFNYHMDGNVIKQSFKEYFTDKAVENIIRKTKKSNIFADVSHQIGTMANIEHMLNDAQTKKGIDLSKEREFILTRMKSLDLPLFKVEDMKLDEKGIFVEIQANPYYREIDEEHKQYFDAVWNSLESGFLSAMSINFKPTAFTKVSPEVTQIDDADVFGISLVSNPANDMATITEVAMRSINELGGSQWQTETTSLLIL